MFWNHDSDHEIEIYIVALYIIHYCHKILETPRRKHIATMLQVPCDHQSSPNISCTAHQQSDYVELLVVS